LLAHGNGIIETCLTGLLVFALHVPAPCQTDSKQPTAATLELPGDSFPATHRAPMDPQASSPGEDPRGSWAVQNSSQTQQHGLIVRSLKRGLNDQKELYRAPFKASNLKWDAMFLAGTAALIATDARISRALPYEHKDVGLNISNICLVGTGATLSSLWAYGIKTKNEHAKETGELELETLANTFLIYTPMQFLAGRERPDEGTGNGRFWQHNGFNTSFPGGHAMFTWAMASVVAHEYPRPWVKALAYGAATSVSLGRFFAHQHFASDTFVGTTLGYFIGTHIFHSHCRPGLSEACDSQSTK
jgi:hypothetical protein